MTPETTEQNHSSAPPILDELKRFGPASQSALAGLYAWVVTVAPLAWSPLAPRGTLALALLVPLALSAAIVIEPKRPRVALIVSVWGAVLPATAVWVRAAEVATAQLDASRGVLGFLGWAAFAFVAAAPPIGQAHVDVKRTEHAAAFVPRAAKPRFQNATILALAALACGFFQWPRSDGSSIERELFVRVVAVAASLLIAARAGDIVASASRKLATPRVISRVWPGIAWLVAWLVIGVFVFLFMA